MTATTLAGTRYRTFAAKNYWQELLNVIVQWCRRSRQRRQLAQLEDWQLRDIGVTRSQAEREAAKSFWRR